ncbi:hypothetical protein C0Q70_19649 [Pomacea canaliculata]|uniref:BAR domain-containing protein n=1 Tax=Pomacea canaliculata TaxID=400727 RepID=A0A2T7NJZ0_POMCA|nr:hypothetical protein C0Q70_19649 [Pomacea canaliculata]
MSQGRQAGSETRQGGERAVRQTLAILAVNMSRTGAEMKASESQSKTIQDRITAIEKHLGQLCDTLGSYTRKTARLRDKGDEMSKCLFEYAEYEKWNPTLRNGLMQFVESLSAVQDYREAQVQRLEKKVVSQLSGYGLLCKQTKNDMKGAFTAQNREQVQKKKLEQMRIKQPHNRQQIAEGELQRASIEASRVSHALEQQVDSFEAKKIRDVKKVLREFVQIELVFHAKALELYTQCFQSINIVDPDADLEEFRRQIRPVNTARKEMASAAQQSLQGSKRSSDSLSTPTVRSMQPHVTNGIRRESDLKSSLNSLVSADPIL